MNGKTFRSISIDYSCESVFYSKSIYLYIVVAKWWSVFSILGLKPDVDGYAGLECRTEGYIPVGWSGFF